MDKVIIDGVDVSGCERFISPTKECLKCETVYDENCKGKNCYFKQLQRAKAENDKLKKELEKHKSMIAHNLKPLFDSDFQNKLKELEHENERLKEEFKRLKESECKICKYFNIDDKYKQTLQEIKEIVETELSYDMVENERKHYRNYDIIRYKIAKAEEE